jgi:thiol-disulfide isomerase/thioredoxin
MSQFTSVCRAPLLIVFITLTGLSACRRSSHEEQVEKSPSAGGSRSSKPEPGLPLPPPTERAVSPPSAKVAAAALGAGYDVPRRGDADVRSLLGAACKQAQSSKKPILLEVGADWCSDCRLLHQMEATDPLRSALSGFEHVTLNLGEDAQEWLRDAFQIKAIARWLVFRPSDCSVPVESWMPLGSRVVEPASKGELSNAASLTSWLEEKQSAQ